VIAFAGGFHGRTMMSLALTGKVTPYKAGFGPFPGDVYHALFPDPAHRVSTQDSLASLDRLFKEDIEPARVAAIIVEPVQGEGGFNIAPIDFLQRLRATCDAHGIVLIVDEIQTGFARTGRLFATEYAGIAPDIIAMAKGLAGGYPLSAITGKADIMDAASVGGLGGTFAGSPVGIAAALAVLDVIEEEKLTERALRVGATIAERFSAFARASKGRIAGVRHLGAMVAMDLVTAGDPIAPDPDAVKSLIAAAQSRGLILLSCGAYGNVLRILTPLTIPDEHLAEGLDILERCLAEVGVL
jgi:4-aminobutyrate aminotransferase/(S)-3-amino-2-methylpropionate transaminase